MPTILVHPGAFNPQGEFNKTSIQRLKKGLRLYKKFLSKGVLSQDIFFISTVGDRGRGGLSQSEMIKEWLVDKGVFPKNIITTDQSGNTWQDISISYRLIRELGLPRTVYHVSNINHVCPRIWMVSTFWGRIYNVQGKYVADSWMSFLDSMGEIIAIWRAISSILKNLWRIKQ